MSDLALDTDGDLLVALDASLLSGAEEVRQALQLNLAAIRGEWFADLDYGTAWFQEILGARYSEAHARRVFSTAILGTTGVTAVSELTLVFDYTTRNLEASFTVSTVYGEPLEFQGVFNG